MIIQLLVFHFTSHEVAITQEYDFEETLAGYGEVGSGDKMRGKVRTELSGREDDIWNYIKDSLYNSSENSSPMAVSAGIRALYDLDGFDKEILDDYARILESESHDVEKLNKVLKLPPTYTGSPDANYNDYQRASKSIGLIRSSFYIFETYGNGLPKQVVTRFLQLNDGSVLTSAAKWFSIHGNRSDVPTLRKRATELKESGDQAGSDLLLSLVDEIASAVSEAPSRTDVPKEEKEPHSKGSDETSSPQKETDSSISTSHWHFVIPSVAILGIAGFLLFVGSRKVRNSP